MLQLRSCILFTYTINYKVGKAQGLIIADGSFRPRLPAWLGPIQADGDILLSPCTKPPMPALLSLILEVFACLAMLHVCCAAFMHKIALAHQGNALNLCMPECVCGPAALHWTLSMLRQQIQAGVNLSPVPCADTVMLYVCRGLSRTGHSAPRQHLLRAALSTPSRLGSAVKPLRLGSYRRCAPQASSTLSLVPHLAQRAVSHTLAKSVSSALTVACFRRKGCMLALCLINIVRTSWVAQCPESYAQHHVRSSSGGSRQEVLASHPAYEQSAAAEASEKASLLSSMVSQGPSHLHSHPMNQ